MYEFSGMQLDKHENGSMISYSGKEAFLAVFRDYLQTCERTVCIHQSPSEDLVTGLLSSAHSAKER